MSWLYAQTWLWYLIAFAVGVLLAWLLLVRPQQRRLRTLQGLAGAGVDHDLYAESRDRLGRRRPVRRRVGRERGQNRGADHRADPGRRLGGRHADHRDPGSAAT